MKRNKNTIVYIVSPRYSGSTLLSFVIGFFNEISTIGERKKFFVKSIKPDNFEKRCSCGSEFSECQKWNIIRNRFLQRVGNVSFSRDFTQFQISNFRIVDRLLSSLLPYLISLNFPFRSLLRFILKEPLKLNKELIESILEVDNNRIFLDSSKPISHILYLSLISDFEIKVIHLHRYAPAQISSAIKHNNWSIRFATDMWLRETSRNISLFNNWKIKPYQLSYEKFCADHTNELGKILNYIGLSKWDFGEINFRKREQHIMGNGQMRLGTSSEIRERKDWLVRLSEDQIKFIENKTIAVQEQLNEL